MWYNEKNKWKVGGFRLFAIATITLIQFVSNKDEPKKIISENRKLAIIHVHVIPIAIILTPCQVQKPMRYAGRKRFAGRLRRGKSSTKNSALHFPTASWQQTRTAHLFSSSNEVNLEIAKIMPIFLVSVPFVAITRIATASFYATEKSVLSYILTFLEPVLMLVLMLVLPCFGGQVMIWWNTVLARIFAAVLALVLTGMQKHKA